MSPLYSTIIPFVSIISIFVFLVKRKPKVIKIDEISQEEEYKNRNKQAFLKSFQEENFIKHSENIDPAFYNREEYNKIISASDNVLEPKWKRRILYESTPRGNIIMFYDAYKEGFSYYSDTQMTYDILNMAAIKYSIFFRCRDFFIDEKQYPHGFISPLVKLKEDQDKKPSSKSMKLEGPFMKSKKSTSNPIVEPIKLYSKNKFVYLGKTRNFSFLKRESTAIKPKIETSYYSIFQSEKNYRKFKESRGL